MKNVPIQLLLLIAFLALSSCVDDKKIDEPHFAQALENGKTANEGFRRCMEYTNAWLSYADPATGLIPENLFEGKSVWNAHNAAADNYPFMVLTTLLLDSNLYSHTMLDMLKTEQRLTSRLGRLPDAYSLAKNDFVHSRVDTNRIIFGTSEYIKDGLIPLTEYAGQTPWFERMLEMINDLSLHINVVKTRQGTFIDKAIETEINGELLQILSRLYWMTGNKKYSEWAIQIGDFYLQENQKIYESERLRLRDHGCEIIGGLSELYVLLHYKHPEKKKEYQPEFYKLLDKVLQTGTNEDGMFYNEVDLLHQKVLDSTIVDNWGYIYNAYYTVYLLDNKQNYKDAVLHVLNNLRPKYQHYDWENGSSDGFADAIESGINLYNREPVEMLKEWLNKEIQVMWSLQDSAFQQRAQRFRNSGIIEGWHGDGNFARTSIMYCLWKTMDVTIRPWREDVIFGAVEKNGDLYISMLADNDWRGKINFGKKRHEESLHLPLDYPRINQFPEWHHIDRSASYVIQKNDKPDEYIDGTILKDGLAISLEKGIPLFIKVTERRK